MAGAIDRFEKYSALVERDAQDAIRVNPEDIRSSYNPYSILLDLYETKGERSKEITLLKKLQTLFPGDRELEDRINELGALIGKQPQKVDSLGK